MNKVPKIGPFPSELYNCGIKCKVDQQFLKIWQRKGAINLPRPDTINFEAKLLARSTLRQAWMSAHVASSERTKQLQLAALKKLKLQSHLFSNRCEQYILALRSLGGHGPHKREAARDKGTRIAAKITAMDLLLCIEGLSLGETGARTHFNHEDYEKFAESFKIVSTFSQALTQITSDEISTYSPTVKNIGAPERRAFTRPFVEAYIYMKGKRPDGKSVPLNLALNSAWTLMGQEASNQWRRQIVTNAILLTDGEVKLISEYGPSWLSELAALIRVKNPAHWV